VVGLPQREGQQERTDGCREREGAESVDRHRVRRAVLRHHPADRGQREQADGNVDQEDRAPPRAGDVRGHEEAPEQLAITMALPAAAAYRL
jgi:hypothetical protein